MDGAALGRGGKAMDVKNALAAHEIGKGHIDLRFTDLRIYDFFLHFITKGYG